EARSIAPKTCVVVAASLVALGPALSAARPARYRVAEASGNAGYRVVAVSLTLARLARTRCRYVAGVRPSKPRRGQRWRGAERRHGRART
ncbi:MAG: hypothetical protein M3P85_04715, partial [Actinomycetota bacterium]|nr:hypothetical protein [Actinomycetota bacterium]